jgi:hypothetical protein
LLYRETLLVNDQGALVALPFPFTQAIRENPLRWHPIRRTGDALHPDCQRDTCRTAARSPVFRFAIPEWDAGRFTWYSMTRHLLG